MAEKRKAEDSVDDTAEKKAAPEAGMVEVPIKEALEQATKALQAVGWDKANAALQVFFDIFTRARRARRARGGGWNCYSFLVVGAVVVAGRTTTTSVYLFHASAHARASLERAIVSPLWTSGAVARLGADDVPKEELSMCPNMRRPPRTHRTSRRPPFPRPPPPQTARCCCGRSAGAAPPRPPRSLCSAPRRRDPPRDGALAARSRAFAALAHSRRLRTRGSGRVGAGAGGDHGLRRDARQQPGACPVGALQRRLGVRVFRCLV